MKLTLHADDRPTLPMTIKHRLIYLIFLHVFLFVGNGYSQIQPEARDLIDSYNKITGGTDAKHNVFNIIYKGVWKMEKMDLGGPGQIILEDGKRFAMILEIPGVGKIHNCYSEGDAWADSPFMGFKKADESEFNGLLRNTYIFPETDIEQHFESATLSALESNGSIGIQLKHRNGTEETWYINPDTSLLTEVQMLTDAGVRGSFLTKIFFEDYRLINGLLIPYQFRWQTPAYEVEFVVNSVLLNTELPQQLFEPPASSRAPTVDNP